MTTLGFMEKKIGKNFGLWESFLSALAEGQNRKTGMTYERMVMAGLIMLWSANEKTKQKAYSSLVAAEMSSEDGLNTKIRDMALSHFQSLNSTIVSDEAEGDLQNEAESSLDDSDRHHEERQRAARRKGRDGA